MLTLNLSCAIAVETIHRQLMNIDPLDAQMIESLLERMN